MAYDLAAIRKAKQTYKTTTPTGTVGVQAPIQAISAATNMTPRKAATPTATNAAQMMVSNTQPRTEQTLNNIQSSVNTPFSFNADTDQGYQSALRAAQQNLQVSQKNTNAQLRASGQGKSSYSETVANQLANQSNENIANNILPQYVQQAYGRYQDNIANQSNLYGLQYQQDVTTPQNEAQLTGDYVPPAAQNAINGILALKQQAETKGITASQRTELSKQADGLRAQLQSLGIDPTKYGANVNSATAGATQQQGLRTLAGQAQDQSVQAQQFNQTQATEQFAYQKARDAISDTQWQSQFDQNVNQFGLNYGLQQLSQQNDQAYREAQLALSQDDNSRQWATLDYNMSQPQTTKTEGLTANQLLSNIKSLYQEPVYTDSVDALTKKVTKVDSGKTKLTTDPVKLTQMFESVVDAGLSDTETKQVLLSLGMSMKDIEKRAQAYSGN